MGPVIAESTKISSMGVPLKDEEIKAIRWEIDGEVVSEARELHHFFFKSGVRKINLYITLKGDSPAEEGYAKSDAILMEEGEQVLKYSKEIEILALLAYSCGGQDAIKKICVADADGDHETSRSTNSEWTLVPSINSNGLVAFSCGQAEDDPNSEPTPDSEICVMGPDGEDFRILTDNDTNDRYPFINDRNQIVYMCEEEEAEYEEALCIVNFDGTGQRQLTGTDLDIAQPVINNMGQIAFECDKNICVIDEDGSGLQQLTDREVRDDMPSINDSGQIVYRCSFGEPNEFEVCLVNFDGTGQRQLTTNGTRSLSPKPSINNHGTIVYECDDEDDASAVSKICIINSDGTGFAMIGADHPGGHDPVINDVGLIAYSCRSSDGTAVCTMKSDGSNWKKITKPKLGIFPSISQ